MPITTGDAAPPFELAETWQTRVTLEDFVGRCNLLLVFHPFAFTPICDEEARDLQETLADFRASNTEILLVSCDTTAARQAWKETLGLEYRVASDFWPHGTVSRAYGVFNEATGAPVRGTFLIDRTGAVVWSLINEPDTRRPPLASTSLPRLDD